LKIVTVVGARPQFVKAAPLSRRIRERHTEILVHTGQHYDDRMSAVFFDELDIPRPDHNLGVGSGAHGAQTGAMLTLLEPLLCGENPDLVLVFGDTNSTLAGALAAAKLHIPVAHVEAGLRSFNRRMPEEVNRVLTDHLSELLFAPSEASRMNLAAEGITRGVHVVGDIMYDAVLMYRDLAMARSRLPDVLELAPGRYYLCTVHRAENTDRPDRLTGILDGLARLPLPVVLPLHPRTRRRLAEHQLGIPANVRVIEPLGFLDMLRLELDAACVLTDSGGVQKEAYYLGVPCVTLREETEWTETVDTGWNRIAGTDPEAIATAVTQANGDRSRPSLYGDGSTADRIATCLGASAQQGLNAAL
jgi:UDP-GlcNAc3NAcA epimerase